MPQLQRSPNERELEQLRKLFLKAETEIINEIGRLRSLGLIDYHAVAALERVQAILQKLQDDCWVYVPRMIEKQFYVRVPEARKILEPVKKHLLGYRSAVTLTAEQTDIVQRLTMNLMGQLSEAAATVTQGLESALLGRPKPDILRQTALQTAAEMEAAGHGVRRAVPELVNALHQQGVTAFVDKAGRNWSLHTYGNMVCRSTSRQAEVLATLTADPEHDLYQISSHGTTCKLCAPFEGRVYSKSGRDPDFPPLAMAFGKVDPNGPDELSNTWLNIHPNCLVPGGTVLAEGVVAHSSREYSGPVITLETSTGNRITVTPNHPILTASGFIPAASLQKGHKIIETSGKYRFLFGEAPNDINVPTPVENIGHSIIEACGGTTISVKSTPVQFHGDGTADGEVKVVFSEGFVKSKFNPLGSKPVGKESFPTAHFRWFHFLSKRPLFQIFNRAFHTAHGIMGGSGFVSGIKSVPVNREELSNLGLRTPANSGNFCKRKPLIMKLKEPTELFFMRFKKSGRNIIKFLSSSSFWKSNRKFFFDSCENFSRKPKFSTKFCASDPLVVGRLEELSRDGALVVSNLVHVITSEYHGKVYNLQTKYGFYTYNNIVTHNCLHAIIPWTSAGRTPEELQAIKDFSNPEKNPFTRDPRTQKQVEAYRNKERAREKWLADYRQFEKYRLTIPDQVPKTFSTFQKHKLANDSVYNDWLYQYQYVIKQESFASLIGIKTAVGVEVTEISKHVIERAVTRHFSAEDVLDALQNPKTIKKKIDANGPSYQLTGERACVVINPETGKVITGWKK